MCSQIPVSQTEPIRSAEPGCVLNHVPRFIYTSPTCLRIGQASQGITDRVQIRADIQTIMLKIIAGVDDDREVFRRENLGKSVSELGATDSAREGNDFHFIRRVNIKYRTTHVIIAVNTA